MESSINNSAIIHCCSDTLSYHKDMGVREDCSNVVKTTIEQLGGIDVIISNAVC